MKTVTNNHSKSILGINSSINYQLTIVKKACPLNGQCQIGKIVYQDTLSINQPKKQVLVIKTNQRKKYFEKTVRENLLMDAYITTAYLSEMHFVKTTQNFLRNSGKSR